VKKRVPPRDAFTSTDLVTPALVSLMYHVLFISSKEEGMEHNPEHSSGFTAAKMGG
jgi:hypothetical protein